MNWWIVGGVVVGVPLLGWLLQRFGLIDLTGTNKSRSSGHGGGFMGVLDEVFAPTRHEAAAELDRQSVLPAPAPLAGDGDKGIFGGKVTIDVSESKRR